MHSFISFLSIVLFVFFTDLASVRSGFATAHTNKTNAEVFFKQSSDLKDDSVSALAYKAAGKMIQSKFETDRKNKKEYFKSGALALNALIDKNPKHVEARFIRLVIQQNTPAILKYNSNINDDKDVVFAGYATADLDVKKAIKNYVASSKKFSKQEVNNLK